MKFKTNAITGSEGFKIKDHWGDKLRVEKVISGDGALFAVNDSVGVHVTAKKLKKLLKLLSEV